MHDRLVRFVLEVALPAISELMRWPALHLFEFFICWADLDTSINAVGGKRAGAFEVPFVEHLLLDFGDATDEVVEALGFYEATISMLEIYRMDQSYYLPGLAR